MRYAKWLWTLAFVSGIALELPAEGAAQGNVSFDAQGGIAFPVRDLSALTDAGPSLGGGIAYWITPRVAVRGGFDANLLKGKDASGTGPEGPDIDLLHYNAGLQVRLTDPRSSPWDLNLNVAGGATTMNADPFTVEGEPVDFRETYFALNGGLGVGYGVSRNVSLFVDGQWYLTFTDADDTGVFRTFSSDIPDDGFNTASALPVSVGVRVRTN